MKLRNIIAITISLIMIMTVPVAGTDEITGTETDISIASDTQVDVGEDNMQSTESARINSVTDAEALASTNSDTSNEVEEYKPWSIKADTTTIMSGDSYWNVRVAAGQKMYGYDTIQGACCHDGYAYMALYNRNNEKIKIAKVNLSTMEIVKVSSVLGVKAHANTLTYNTRTNQIIVVCGAGGRKVVAIVKAGSLKLKETRTISISKKVLGEKFVGINAIAYNQSSNQYVLKVSSTSNAIIILNSEFKVVKKIDIEGNRSYLTPQGLYAEGDYMYDIQSFKGTHLYNLITVRKISDGSLVGRIKVYSGTSGQLYELENIFHDEMTGTWYLSYYRSTVRQLGDIDRQNYLCIINNMPSFID